MKHKTLRTLLCVILTVCFCLSAIVPASAAGLFGGESGIASQWDQWIRSLKDLKDRIIEKNPGTDETPAEPMAGTGEEFIRIFHLDCGRKYFSVDDIKKIINWIAENHYTHIELAFGNDGFRFLLDDMAVGGYTSDQVKAAITAGNEAYNKECNYSPEKNELTQTEMDGIITYAASKGISVIPMLDVPGHAKALIEAMIKLGMSVESKQTGNNNMGYPMYAFKAGDNDATKFAVDLVKKYVDYFKLNGSKYFNIAGDECGNSSFVKVDELVPNLITPLSSYILDSGMKPMMFNDAFRLDNELKVRLQNSGIIICYWTNGDAYDKVETLANVYKYTIINTHNKWYYVAGKEKPLNSSWAGTAFSYTWAIANMTNGGNPGEGDFRDCTACDGNYKTSTGCMVAFWCDNPGATVNYSNLKTYIETLPKQNPDYFRAASETPLPSIVIGGNNTELTVGENVIMSTSDGSLAAWSSSNPDVLTLKDNDAVEKALLSETSSVTVQAVGAGEAAITAVLRNGNTISTAPIKVKTADTATEKTITVTVSGTAMSTTKNVNYTGTYETDDSSIATIESVKTYSSITVKIRSIATNVSSNTWTKSDEYYYLADDGNPYSVYVMKYRTGVNYYAYGYKKAENDDVTIIKNDNSNWWSGNADAPLYRTPASTSNPAFSTITFTGVAVGTTYATVAGVRYKINVIAENLSGVTPLAVQTWITTNAIESANKTSTSNAYWAASWGVGRNGEAYYVNVSAKDAYGEQGKSIAELLPTYYNYIEYGGTYWADRTIDLAKTPKELVVWSGRVHNADDSNVQKIYGKDYSNSGTEFNYIRYYGGKWEVSPDGSVNSWVEVAKTAANSNSVTGEQVVVYYMIRSTITAEITTDVADWGAQYGETAYNDQVNHTSQYFVLLDFAVKYEGGAINPDTFPVQNKTFAFHCQEKDSGGAVHQNGNYYYRELNNFRAVNTSEYEVYMVTVTMTSDTASETITSTNAKTANGYTYDGEEQVLWAVDSETREQFNELKDYTSISGSKTYSGCKIGGEPYIRGVEVYRKHGALITYYVRVKTVEEKLTVNYYVDGLKPELIHTYDIGVKAGTRFKDGIAIGTEKPNTNKKGYLINSEVTNAANNEEKINVDLTKINQIPAKYRFADFECVKVETIGENTVVNLYYKFSTSKAFVVDFGLPLTIAKESVNDNQSLKNANITGIKIESTSKYASIETTSTYDIVYTLKKPLDIEDVVKVTYSGDNTETGKHDEITYTISIIPATNVLYEETFITNPENSGWTNTATADSVEQTLEESGNKQNVYGYDTKVENYYLGNPDGTSVAKGFTYSMGNALTTTLSIPAGAKEAITEKPLTFSFKGTGFDLISKCSDKTGILLVYIKGTKLNADGKPYQGVFLVDTYFAGDNAPEGSTAIMAKGTTVYQVPVVREFGAFNKKYDTTLTENAGLPYDTYQVSVYAYLNNNAGVFDNNAAAVASYSAVSVSDSSIIADALAACNITDIDADQVKLVYMDENSILNGGTGAVAEQSAVSMASLYTATVDSAEVYVDAFRVYNPLGDTTVQISNEKFDPAEKNEVQTYKDDKESGVKYMSLYDFVVGNLGSYGNEEAGTSSSVYIEYDGNKPASEQIVGKEYKVHGPENEIYLAAKCGIAFHINQYSDGQTIQISAKAVYGSPTLNGVDVTATEMYYDLANPNISQAIQGEGTGRDIVIFNNGEGVLAISGLKCSTAINISANTSATQAAIQTIRYAMSAKEVSYAPATFEITAPETARRNRSIGIGVTATAADVDSMKIQVTCDGVVVGEETILYPYNVKAVEQGKATNYYYSKSYRFSKAGTYVFTATASDGNGNSYSIEKTVVVK